MTEEEILELARLLRKVSAEELGAPRLPKDVFLAMRGVITQPTVEVLVTRDGRDVLLTPRHDRHWDGWHLPGGFVGVGESLEDACARIARRELGVGATMERLVGHYTWTDHPYASALSLLCLCRLEGEAQEGQFFSELPANLIPQQRTLLERWWPVR
ncbi:MAG TPA: NUDIX domain-containing protein [Polyangiales bacterium]